MKLIDYLVNKKYSPVKLTISKFAESLELSPSHISNYLHGRNRMSKKVARHIQRITDGQVTIEELMEGNPEKPVK